VSGPYYERSEAGQTGLGKLDVQPEAGAPASSRQIAARATLVELAMRELKRAAELDLIRLEPAHSRDRANIYKVRSHR